MFVCILHMLAYVSIQKLTFEKFTLMTPKCGRGFTRWSISKCSSFLYVSTIENNSNKFNDVRRKYAHKYFITIMAFLLAGKLLNRALHPPHSHNTSRVSCCCFILHRFISSRCTSTYRLKAVQAIRTNAKWFGVDIFGDATFA